MDPAVYLHEIKIASPCSADWNQMQGDVHVRFCGQCQKHVYDLSAMAAQAAVDLIVAHEGQLCGRLHRRHDGTVIVDDCPIGAARLFKRAKRVVVAGAALVLLAAGGALAPNLMQATDGSRTAPGSGVKFSQSWRDLVADLKVWLGIGRRPADCIAGALVPPNWAAAGGTSGTGSTSGNAGDEEPVSVPDAPGQPIDEE